MNVSSKNVRIAQTGRLSRPEAGIGSLHYHRQGRERSRAFDLHPQQMRLIGLILCLISAAITVASATLIAVRF